MEPSYQLPISKSEMNMISNLQHINKYQRTVTIAHGLAAFGNMRHNPYVDLILENNF